MELMRMCLPEIERWPSVPADHRPALLLMVYDCRPATPGEAGAGWVRVVEAAREFEIHAIVGPESYDEIDVWRKTNPMPASLHIHTPERDALWRLLARRGTGRTLMAYRYWQKLAYKLSMKLHAEHRFALVHQVNPARISEPGEGWRLGIPFIWGPAGGTEMLPAEFITGLGLRDQLSERAREKAIRWSLRSRRVRRAAAKATVLLAGNSSAQRDFERAFRRPVELVPMYGIDTVIRPETSRFRFRGTLNLVWAGELAHPSGLPLLLEAVANLGHDVDYHLHVLGTGAMELEWKALAGEMGVRRRCTFHGAYRHDDLLEHLDQAHMYVFTSLRNTSAANIAEALGCGVPVMCFDQHAAADMVTPSCGVKVPVLHPGQTIAAMATSIRELAQDRTRLLRLSSGACERAQNYLWREDTQRMLSIYRMVAEVEVPVRQLSGGAA